MGVLSLFLGRDSPCWGWDASLNPCPRAVCGPLGTVPKLWLCDHRPSSQHFTSKMNLWHILREVPLLQACGIPTRSDSGARHSLSLLSALMTEVFLSWTMGRGCAGSQNSYKPTEIGFSIPCLLLSSLLCFPWVWKGNKGWGQWQRAGA